MARDAPDVLERVKAGEFKSARAAAIEAGIIKPVPTTARRSVSGNHHHGDTMTTTRDLIRRLADELTNAIRVIHNEDGTQHISTATPVLDKARAYLAQSETEELTDEEIVDEARKYLVNEYALPAEITYFLDSDNFEHEPTIGCFRAVIAADRARWGRPAVHQSR